MNKELEGYLKVAKPVEDHDFLNGRIVKHVELIELEEELLREIPDWIIAMLTTYPIAGLVFRFEAMNGETQAIQFNDFDEISDNYYTLNPGCIVADMGYLCIADDPTGSGNPYFIKLEDGDNPPVYQIEHNFSKNHEQIITNGRHKIAERLSDIFEKQEKLEEDEIGDW